MAAQVLVPNADGGADGMCWLCAHMVADHGASPEDAIRLLHTCTCERAAIFPSDVVARREREQTVLAAAVGITLHERRAHEARVRIPPTAVPAPARRRASR